VINLGFWTITKTLVRPPAVGACIDSVPWYGQSSWWSCWVQQLSGGRKLSMRKSCLAQGHDKTDTF